MEKIVNSMAVLAFSIMISGFSYQMLTEKNEAPTSKTASGIEIPQNVKGILEKSCTGCHEAKSSNEKGKMKLNFDKMVNGEYTAAKIVGKLNGITKVLNEGTMPPAKFLEKYPDRKLTAADNKILMDWASSQAQSLMAK